MKDDRFSSEEVSNPGFIARTGLEPELGLPFQTSEENRSGFEPELGGGLQQKAVYVDESTCIGCRYCSHVARNTFYLEPDYGRSRVIRQDGDSEELIQEAIDTCPVDCIHWVDYQALQQLEDDRRFQVLQPIGLPMDVGIAQTHRRKARERAKRSS